MTKQMRCNISSSVPQTTVINTGMKEFCVEIPGPFVSTRELDVILAFFLISNEGNAYTFFVSFAFYLISNEGNAYTFFISFAFYCA